MRKARRTPALAAENSDLLLLYVKDIGRHPMLSRDEEYECGLKVMKGDVAAQDALVHANLRFVISIVKPFATPGSLPLTDLISEGNIGLITAARKFDPTRGVRFISYAVWWIRQSVLAALATKCRSVRLPLGRTSDLSKLLKASEHIRTTTRKEPTTAQLTAITKIPRATVQALLASASDTISLDGTLDVDATFGEYLAPDDVSNADDRVMQSLEREEVARALASLGARDAKILTLYFGLADEDEHTLEEIGVMLGITRERVRQLRDRAVAQLREGGVGRALRTLVAA